MKRKYIFGLLILALSMLVWPVMAHPEISKTDYGTETSISPEIVSPSIDAQAITGTDILTVTAVNQTVSDIAPDPSPVNDGSGTVEKTISEISTAFNIPIDTVNSLDEISDKGIYYVNSVPDKGSPLSVWVSYIVGIVGFLFGVFFFLKQKYWS